MPPADRTLSSPNTMVWNYFSALRRSCARIRQLSNDKETKQESALCIVLSVTCVEVFFNVHFRVLVSESGYRHAAERILSDLKKQVSLDVKIKEWPQAVFSRRIELGEGSGQRFVALKNLRNHLMHFSSSHETVDLPGSVTIHGLADTTKFESLEAMNAVRALEIAEEFICEVFRLRGIPEKDLVHSLHTWTGRAPIEAFTRSAS